MTDENKALVAEIFQRYGSPSTDGEIHIRDYLIRPDKLNTEREVKCYDESAACTIRECEHAIAQMQAYRQALAERYNYIATAPAVSVVRLARDRNRYDNKVYYFLRTFRRILDDGTETVESEAKYPGTERRKALADFDAYVKAHPGIVAEKDIEKSRWER